MHYPKANQKLMSLAVASACAALIPAYAQTTAADDSRGGDIPTTAVQQVVVTGLRQSMASSLNLKRQSDGIVDGIVAEDIGKFPDTNLAESLQRISGVSIDRVNGEGQKITVRGVGPDFNMVLLNGRQMPTSNLGDLNGRSFDFSNLASEAISQLQVYKTSRAETPTGGIGATVNVITARPLDKLGTWSSIGIKGVYDKSNDNLPGDVKASKSATPEFSGIYSTTSQDGHWGLGASASYQERNLGFNQAAVSNGWRGPFRGEHESIGRHRVPEWFLDAKFGMFVDWGPWSVGGWAPQAEKATYPDWYEQRLLKDAPRDLRATVVVAPHHGSASSSSPGFVAATGAELVVFSAGHGNRFGHPRSGVVAWWRRAGARDLVTAQGGAIRVWLRGNGTQFRETRRWPARWWDAAERRRATAILSTSIQTAERAGGLKRVGTGQGRRLADDSAAPAGGGGAGDRAGAAVVPAAQ